MKDLAVALVLIFILWPWFLLTADFSLWLLTDRTVIADALGILYKPRLPFLILWPVV